MPSGLKIVRPLPPPAVLNSQIQKRMKANLTPLARKHAFFRQVLVAGWKSQHTPRFAGLVTIDQDTVSIDIVITNANQRIDNHSRTTVDDLWTWWSETGTKKHLIRPIRARALRFPIGNQIIFAMLVRHPGTRPNKKAKQTLRKTNAQLSGSLSPLLVKSIQEGLQK